MLLSSHHQLKSEVKIRRKSLPEKDGEHYIPWKPCGDCGGACPQAGTRA